MATIQPLSEFSDCPVPPSPGEIRACLVVRNEARRLPSTIRHHRALGVDRFLVIDNGSTDGTLEFLEAQPDIHVFTTHESFAATNCGLDWTNTILDAFADGHWALTVDADEMFIYPHYEQVKLQNLCRFLDNAGVRGILALMLDMYSGKPLDQTMHRPDGALIETCPYFDPAPYWTIGVDLFPRMQIYGGVRARVFRHAEIHGHHPPTLSKVPLVKWRKGTRYLHATHVMSPVRLSRIGGALLHFKFLRDFHERARSEVARGEHFNGAREYKAYLALLERNGSVNFRNGESVRFRDSAQLVHLGLMQTVPAYEQFAAELGGHGLDGRV